MTDVQETSANEERDWLELANGGGVMLRERSASDPSEPRYGRYRQPKRLEAPGLEAGGKDP